MDRCSRKCAVAREKIEHQKWVSDVREASFLTRFLKRRLVIGDELAGGNARDGFADRVESQVFHFLEPDARLAHVELLSRLRPLLAEPCRILGGAVNAHQV